MMAAPCPNGWASHLENAPQWRENPPKWRENACSLRCARANSEHLGRYGYTRSSTSYEIATTRSIFSAIGRIPIFGIEPFSRRASRCHFPRPSEANGITIRPHFPLNNSSLLQTASNRSKSYTIFTIISFMSRFM